MKSLCQIFLVLFLQTGLLLQTGAQTVAPDSLQTERLVKLCQLWGHAHFFHPVLAYRDLPFDSAFAAAVPMVLAAKNSAAYSDAISVMLGSLQDPVTEVIDTKSGNEGSFTVGERYPVSRYEGDSILVISIRNFHDLSDWETATEKLTAITLQIPSAHGVIFDLRAEKSSWEYTWYFNSALDRSGMKNALTNIPLTAPGSRSRTHDGFAPEQGSSSGGYSSGFQVKDGERILPKGKVADFPVVFLINDKSILPPVALSLQAAGKGGIVAVGPVSDASFGAAVAVDMGENLKVNLRISELVSGSGEVGFRANRVLPIETDDESAFRNSLAFLKKKDFSLEKQTNAPPALAVPSASRFPPGNFPGLGHRVLAGAKIWAVIHYFFAYKDLMTEDWNLVLREFIPKLIASRDSLEYTLAIAEMYAHIHDGHGFIRSPVLRSYFGEAPAPVVVRMVENKAVITAIAVDSIANALGLAVGDVVLEVDGQPAIQKLESIEKYISASNQNWGRSMAVLRLLGGAEGTIARVKIEDGKGKTKTVAIPRSKAWQQAVWDQMNDRNKLPVMRKLPGNIGYADLERLSQEQVDTMFRQFKNTKAIIFDMRGYPRGTAWTIAPRLTEKKQVAGASFQRYLAQAPDISDNENYLSGFSKTSFIQPIPTSSAWKYKGKTVMLIDERTMSQAEHSGLFYEAANGTEFIGSQTAGANGDVTNFQIPGGIWLSFSGHDVRHADGRQLQQVGLVPKIQVRPTIKGIRAGRDEVLERAIEYLTKGK